MFWSLFLRSLLLIFVIIIIGQSIYSLYYHKRKNIFDDEDDYIRDTERK